MRKLLLGAVAAAVLAAPGAGTAGGWATVGVEPLPPTNVDEPWNVTVTVLRHGRAPTDGAEPLLTIRNKDNGSTKTYTLKPIGEGRYTARVEFPSAGTWSYAVNNGLAATGHGMSATQSFAAVEVSAAGSGGGDTSVPAWPVAGGIAAALALGAAALFARRRRPRPEVAPSA